MKLNYRIFSSLPFIEMLLKTGCKYKSQKQCIYKAINIYEVKREIWAT